jgi:hypothetical protein
MRHERKLSYSRSDKQRITNPLVMIRLNGVRSVQRNGRGISQYLSQGLANPHPHSIVNGTNREREVARPTVAGTPDDLVKPFSGITVNPFSRSADPARKPPTKTGRVLLAESAAAGRRAALCPKPAAGVAPAPGA